ncbi:sensor histidine kinase [Paucibacter soli]|uniref:sensor histidine kinase n=1 Tax=Paucibacter soli TaxID=3133433 RepID=UPI00309FC19B
MNAAVPLNPTLMQRWQRFSKACVRGFHVYANWLVSISWKRFVVLSLLLLIGTNILQDLPPFTWRVTEHVDGPALPKLPKLPKPASSAKLPAGLHYEVKIDKHGVRIVPMASPAASGVEAQPGVEIKLPESISSEDAKAAIEQAKDALEELAQQARAAQEAAEEVRDEARQALEEAGAVGSHTRTRVVHLGDFLVNLAVFIILGSGVIKVTYKGRIQAEVKAAQAEETAEAESLKRQVIEARMAAMQAQVEPHFLFNTLASIDHLIETDPPRASQMQRNLIALLRASMPTMREANAGGVRDLGREMSVIKPYLEILKVRMEERLQTEIDVPEGLLSAEFPPMMIQSLVENAIKHGLEPKAEGGSLKVKAEIVHGKLAVTVADTGLGFGRAATAGTGVGLANIRERLMLLYGSKGGITVTENQPSGTIVTITVPYRSRNQDHEGA